MLSLAQKQAAQHTVKGRKHRASSDDGNAMEDEIDEQSSQRLTPGSIIERHEEEEKESPDF